MILLLTILFFSQTKAPAVDFLRCEIADLKVTSSSFWWNDVGASTGACKSGATVKLNTKCVLETKNGGTCTHTPLSASAQPSAPLTINQIECRQVVSTSGTIKEAAWYDITNGGKKIDLSAIQCTSSAPAPSAPTPTAPSTGAAPAADAPPSPPSTLVGVKTVKGKNCAMLYHYTSYVTGIPITVNNGGCICPNPQTTSCTSNAFCGIQYGAKLNSNNVKDGATVSTGTYGITWDYCKQPVMTWASHVAAPMSQSGKTIEAESSLNYILTENSPILTMFALIGVLAIVYNLGLSAQKVIKKQGDSYDEVMEMQTEDI